MPSTPAGALTSLDVKLSAKRRFFDRPIAEPAYDSARVPSAKADLKGSFLVRVEDRDVWMMHLTEMLLLCNEAAWRRAERDKAKHAAPAAGATAAAAPRPSYLPPIVPHEPKPLLLEYLADRLDTDDPLNGYVVRCATAAAPRPGCPPPSPPAYPLQGFVLYTNFTTWSPHFHFVDNLHEVPLAGVTADDFASHRVDHTGAVARALDAHPRRGDPEEEGMVWSRVAEVSLLGALGCGATLLRFVLDELAASGEYDHVVLQATDQAVPFYESMGFVRVGCVACSDDEVTGISLAGCPYNVLAESNAAACAAAEAARSAADAEGGLAGPGLAAMRAAADAVPPSDPSRDDVLAHARRLYWVHKVMRACLRHLRKLEMSSVFAHPVSEEEVPGYRSVVREPMSYYDVQRRLSLGHHPGGYRCWAQFTRDVLLIAENSVFFNRLKTSMYHKLGVTLRREARALFAAWERRCGAWLVHADPLARCCAAASDGADAPGAAPAQNGDAALPAAAPPEGPPPAKRTKGRPPKKKARKVDPEPNLTAAAAAAATTTTTTTTATATTTAPTATAPPNIDPFDPELLAAYNASARDDPCVLGYVHWTFHDQPVEDQYPSYMMARAVQGPHEPAPACPEVPAGACTAVPRGNGKYAAKVVRGGAHSYLGIFESEKEAIERYEEAAKEYDDQHRGLPEAPFGGQRRAPPPRLYDKRKELLETRPAGFEVPPLRAADDPGTSVPSNAHPVLREGRPVPVSAAPVSFGTKAKNLIQTTLPLALARARVVVSGMGRGGGGDGGAPDAAATAASPNAIAPPPEPLAASAAAAPANVALSPQDMNARALARAACPALPEAPKKGQPKLYNKTVKVLHRDEETYPHTYWFVYQFVPDMRWAHLCPLVIAGYFAGNSTSKRYGRPRYKLAPEGTVRELDVAAHRIQVVKSEQVAKTTNADEEVWDVMDDDEIPPVLGLPPKEEKKKAS